MLLFALISLPVPSFAASVDRAARIMGTEFSVRAYGADRNLLDNAVGDALAEAERIDRMLSNYIPDSELSIVNARASNGPVHVSREFFDLLSQCEKYSRQSEGTFDITVGPLMKAWGFFRNSGHLPAHSAVQAALAGVGYANVVLDASECTVRFKKRGVELDPGGVGKGYAVDRMVTILRKDGVRSALVSAGGSSIYALGVPPAQEKGWYLQIQDPRNESKAAGEVYLKDASISTSGSYEKFFWADGKVYNHIMDPRTGYPAQGMLSVSVVAPLTLDSEIWAKPYFILGRSWTESHKPKRFRAFLCEDKPGSSCEWL